MSIIRVFCAIDLLIRLLCLVAFTRPGISPNRIVHDGTADTCWYSKLKQLPFTTSDTCCREYMRLVQQPNQEHCDTKAPGRHSVTCVCTLNNRCCYRSRSCADAKLYACRARILNVLQADRAPAQLCRKRSSCRPAISAWQCIMAYL